jgi:hypothetical protein
MNAREQRAAAREAVRVQQAAGLVAGVAQLPVEDDEEGHLEVPVPARAAAAVPPLDPGMWLNMVNVKPPQLLDLELGSMKKFILDYKRYAQKCPQPLLRGMQHFILEDHVDIIADFDLQDREDVMALGRDDFITVMLKMHQATSSPKWRLMMKNAIMEKSDLSLSTYVQYVDDFKFWIQAASSSRERNR